MEFFIDRMFSIIYIAVFLIGAFALMMAVGRITNYFIRKIFGIGG